MNKIQYNMDLIAPCGMNCGICLAHLREKNACPGCRGHDKNKSKGCVNCIIKNCDFFENSNSKFCFECKKYPCSRLIQLDKRYRSNYNMSMIENLGNIKEIGLEQFVENEHHRWLCTSCGGTICVHRGYCLNCPEN